jgi:hypothetical protein
MGPPASKPALLTPKSGEGVVIVVEATLVVVDSRLVDVVLAGSSPDDEQAEMAMTVTKARKRLMSPN